MTAWTTELPTKPGRYFIRPAGSAHQGKVAVVGPFGGDLVCWSGPELYEHFRMADLSRVHIFVNEDRLEWSYIDDDASGEFRHWTPLSELNNHGIDK